MLKRNGVIFEVTKDDMEILQDYPDNFWEGCTIIGVNSFSYCPRFNEISIPSTVKEIKEQAFEDCHHLYNVDIAEGVKSIGDQAFHNCDKLETITFPGNVNYLGDKLMDYNLFKYLYVLNDGRVRLSTYKYERDAKESYSLEDISEVFPGIDLKECLYDTDKLNKLIKKAAWFKKNKIILPYCVDNFDEFNRFLDKNFKMMKNIDKLISDYINDPIIPRKNNNLGAFYRLANNMGLFEDSSVTIKVDGKDVPVNAVAYTVLQGALKRKDLDYTTLGKRFQKMKLGEYNEEFLKFMANKTNISELKMVDEEQHQSFTCKVYDWFEKRKHADITEENKRYKIMTYDTVSSGADKIKWKSPTVELLKREFEERGFEGVTEENKEISILLSRYSIYGQKHFDKAVEIDRERQESKVKDFIIEGTVKEDLISSLKDFEKRIEDCRNNIVRELGDISKNQVDVASYLFTYEMLAKSDKANLIMGSLTDCCATLYGVGAGAQRAMILHPDMQPLVVKDISGNIVAFGIIYVNREEGYAVVNNFEVNKKYWEDSYLEEIHYKAMKCVDDFVHAYNKENSSKPIKLVTCGLSSNWRALNNFIKENRESSLLDAPDFNEYKYVGSKSWQGDWHKKQYVIWENNNEIKKK